MPNDPRRRHLGRDRTGAGLGARLVVLAAAVVLTALGTAAQPWRPPPPPQPIGGSAIGAPGTVTFSCTGQAADWTVPAAIHGGLIQMAGAQGGAAARTTEPNIGALGGVGGLAWAAVTLTPGDTVHISPGCAGDDSTHLGGTGAGGFGGGGNGAGVYGGGGGGGATDVRLNTRHGPAGEVTAGGGGGGGEDTCGYPAGGAGSGADGQPGRDGGYQFPGGFSLTDLPHPLQDACNHVAHGGGGGGGRRSGPGAGGPGARTSVVVLQSGHSGTGGTGGAGAPGAGGGGGGSFGGGGGGDGQVLAPVTQHAPGFDGPYRSSGGGGGGSGAVSGAAIVASGSPTPSELGDGYVTIFYAPTTDQAWAAEVLHILAGIGIGNGLTFVDRVAQSVAGLSAVAAPAAPPPPPGESPTTALPGGGSGSQPGGGGPGLGPDTTPPRVSGVAVSPNPNTCSSTSVSAQASDNVGVTSVTVQWTYQGTGHSAPMSPAGGSSYSASLGVLGGNGGAVSVTVVARDAAGNTGSGSTSALVTLC